MAKYLKFVMWLILLLFFTNNSIAQSLNDDINNDGKIDESDVSALVEAYVKNEAVTSITDIDGDNALTIADVTALISLANKNESSDMHNGHEYVDLGLPSGTLWATCNVDANTPEDGGGAYAWGETELKEDYSWDTYKWATGRPTKDNHTITKYCDRNGYGTIDGKMTLDAEDDVAHVKWGGSWHIPTDTEWQELMDNCTAEWKRQNGVRGYQFSGNNGKSIFIPVGDYRYNTQVVKGDFEYWSSSLRPDAHATNVNGIWRANSQLELTGMMRYEGHTVRPVISELKPVINDQTAPSSYLGHDLVDLGLPSGTLWATCNLGAFSPDDYGCYYAWGETEGSCEGKESFREDTYVFYADLNELGVENDAAAVNWGGEWRMPTRKQINELRNSRYTSWVWASVNGINGYRVVSIVPGYTDKSIFLPAAGYYVSSELNFKGEHGHYLSSEVDPSSESNDVSYLLFKSTGNGNGSGDRVVGRSIRPVVLLNSINQ